MTSVQLWHASTKGDLPAVLRLLSEGADLHALGGTYKSIVLHQACWFGHCEIIRALLDAGADPEAKDQDELTPLYLACQEGQVEAAKILLGAGANMEAAADKGCTPLHIACNHGRLAVVQLLVEECANLDAQSHLGWTALHYATRKGHLATVRQGRTKFCDKS